MSANGDFEFVFLAEQVDVTMCFFVPRKSIPMVGLKAAQWAIMG